MSEKAPLSIFDAQLEAKAEPSGEPLVTFGGLAPDVSNGTPSSNVDAQDIVESEFASKAVESSVVRGVNDRKLILDSHASVSTVSNVSFGGDAAACAVSSEKTMTQKEIENKKATETTGAERKSKNDVITHLVTPKKSDTFYQVEKAPATGGSAVDDRSAPMSGVAKLEEKLQKSERNRFTGVPGPWLNDFKELSVKRRLEVKTDFKYLMSVWIRLTADKRRHLVRTALHMWGSHHNILGKRGNSKRMKYLLPSQAELDLLKFIALRLHTQKRNQIGALLLETAYRDGDLLKFMPDWCLDIECFQTLFQPP